MTEKKPHIVIIGGGFGGLNAACDLGRLGFPVTLIDKENFHLFQPLLYQVATGFLTPGDIASPLRSVLSGYKTVKVIQDEIFSIDPQNKKVKGAHNEYSFDILVVAAGVNTSYFSNENWQKYTTGLKSLEDSLKLRSEVLSVFEAAERSTNDSERIKLLTFVIVGGGPTGVELAGALSELSKATLRDEFRNFDPKSCKIVLYEGGERLLSAFHPRISAYTKRTLEKIGVDVHTGTFVTEVGDGYIESSKGGIKNKLESSTIIWAAGVKASPLAAVIKEATGAKTDAAGRVHVSNDLSIPGYPGIFVIGDLAFSQGKDGRPLPGLAPVAMQQGKYIAKIINRRFLGKKDFPFSYFDKGNMAVIGKGRAVAETGFIKLTGFPAWLGWAFIHIFFLIEFENKLVVFLRWAWNFFTNKRGSRLITKFN